MNLLPRYTALAQLYSFSI